MRFLSILFLILFLAALVVFCFQNLGEVRVTFLNWGMPMPLWLLAVINYVLGMISGGALLSLLRRSIRMATETRGGQPAV